MEILKIIIYLFVSLFGLFLTYLISKRFDIFDYPNEQKIHLNKTPNIAGMALIFVFGISIFIDNFSNDIIMIFIISSIIAFIGLYDDLKNLSVKIKLLLISLPVILFTKYVSSIFYIGQFFSLDLNLGNLNFIFTFMCILLLINAVNYMDGIDGLLSILLILSFTFILILLPSEEAKTLIPIIVFLFVFLLFNFNILPKQFLGDSGSLSLGFILASLTIYYTQSLKYINPTIIIWCLSFYVYEFLTINVIRILKKKNVFTRDLNFIFNILNLKYGKFYTLLFCVFLKIFYLINGLVLNYFKLYTLSLVIFFIHFIIYLYFRLRQVRSN